MNAKHAKTLRAVFTRPTLAGILFSDMEALLLALGAEMREGAGSRVVFEFRGKRWYPHRPHPGKEAKRKSVLGPTRSVEAEAYCPWNKACRRTVPEVR